MFNILSHFSSFNVLLLIIIFILGLSDGQNVTLDKIPPPENPNYALEQRIVNRFRKYEDQALTCGQLIASRGFKYESHFVTTKDGYILQLYRIVNPYARAALGNKLKPILIVHGFVLSCSSWMINGPGGHIKPWINGQLPNDTSESLAFALANREFDVWLGNFRGTTYSLGHISLNYRRDPEYWDITLKELALYDVPAMVDYVINETKHEKIIWFGYSQSSLSMFTLLSEHPEFADKLELNINSNPVAFLGDIPGVSNLVPNFKSLLRLESLYLGPLLPIPGLIFGGASIICSIDVVYPVCLEIFNGAFGFDRPMVKPNKVIVFYSQIDQTTSELAIQALQAIKDDHTRYFDYGKKKNLKIYGSIEPPKIPFQNIPTYNLVLISGSNDFLAPPFNVQKLRNVLKGRPLVDHIVTNPLWTHVDILTAEKAFEYNHNVTINIIRNWFSNSTRIIGEKVSKH